MVFAYCQVCGKAIKPSQTPWVWAVREIAGGFGICHIHYECYGKGIREGSIKAISPDGQI
jgi:hypothetical protein